MQGLGLGGSVCHGGPCERRSDAQGVRALGCAEGEQFGSGCSTAQGTNHRGRVEPEGEITDMSIPACLAQGAPKPLTYQTCSRDWKGTAKPASGNPSSLWSKWDSHNSKCSHLRAKHLSETSLEATERAQHLQKAIPSFP